MKERYDNEDAPTDSDLWRETQALSCKVIKKNITNNNLQILWEICVTVKRGRVCLFLSFSRERIWECVGNRCPELRWYIKAQPMRKEYFSTCEWDLPYVSTDASSLYLRLLKEPAFVLVLLYVGRWSTPYTLFQSNHPPNILNS